MKKVFILSIQHTGTYFASATISAAYPLEKQLRVGSLWERHRQRGHKRFVDTSPIELSDFTKPEQTIDSSWFDQAVTSVCTPEELAGKNIIVGHEHHHKAQSWLIKAIANAPPKIPIIIPMRDPLLSLHSKLWREDEQHNNPNEMDDESRIRRLSGWIERYIEILSIPQNHAFILPIDASQSKSKNGRLKLIQDMYCYCGVPFNDSARDATLAWEPDNKTADLIARVKADGPHPHWEHFKQRYALGDVVSTRAFMALEFDELNKQTKLKELLQKVGYRKMLWW